MLMPQNPFFDGENHKAALRRTLPKAAPARRRLAWQLASVSNPSFEQRETLVALGQDAFPALLFLCRNAKGERLDRSRSLLAKVAISKDTPVIWELYKPLDKPQGRNLFMSPGDGSELRSWLRDKGDPKFVGRIFFPRFQTANRQERQNLLPFVLRSPEKSIVDTLFALLKDPKGDLYLRSKIYSGIAYCERTDILDWLLKNRRTARTLTQPNSEMSMEADTDGDGLVDALDVNPYAAPRALSDAERVVQTAIEAEFHFSGPSVGKAFVGFTKGTQPFELFGWDGPILPTRRVTMPMTPKPNDNGQWDYVFISWEEIPKSEKQFVRFEDHGKQAVLNLGVTSGPFVGGGTRITLRKISGTWYVVRSESTWGI